jgi:hypothetical protein
MSQITLGKTGVAAFIFSWIFFKNVALIMYLWGCDVFYWISRAHPSDWTAVFLYLKRWDWSCVSRHHVCRIVHVCVLFCADLFRRIRSLEKLYFVKEDNPRGWLCQSRFQNSKHKTYANKHIKLGLSLSWLFGYKGKVKLSLYRPWRGP